jgi:hypothetical protein
MCDGDATGESEERGEGREEWGERRGERGEERGERGVDSNVSRGSTGQLAASSWGGAVAR